MCLRHPRISKISSGHALSSLLATLVITVPAAAYGRKSSTPKLKFLSTALRYLGQLLKIRDCPGDSGTVGAYVMLQYFLVSI